MTTLLRSYDHYAPDIAATVLPGVPVPSGPYWTGTVTRRSVAAGSRIRWADGTYAETELVRLDEQLAAYALLPGASTCVRAHSSPSRSESSQETSR